MKKKSLIIVKWMAAMMLLVSVMPMTRTVSGQIVADPDLVSEWHFDEGEGDITYDSSGNDFNGNIVNPKWIQGISGSALNLTEDTYVTFDQSPMNSHYMSVEFWIKDDGVISHTNHIFARECSGGLAYGCFIYPNHGSDGNLLMCTKYPDAYWPWFAVSYTPDSTWKFYTITFEHGPSHFPLPPGTLGWTPYRQFDLRVYMNGEEVPIVTGDVGITTLDSVAPFIIGRNRNLFSPLGASLDEFKIYNRVLTADEAREHYEAYMKLEVDIDIKPGSDPNSINLCSNGVVPIAILGSDTFNVLEVNIENLRFAEAALKVVGVKDPHTLCKYEDVNDDSIDDLVCHFVTADIAGIDGESTLATVNGELLDGTPIEGNGSIKIVKDTCN